MITARYVPQAAIVALSALTPATLGQTTLSWSTIDCGGGTSFSGSLSLTGTIAQPDAGRLVSGGVVLCGGFWAVDTAAPPACYANCDASTSPPVLNINDFSCFLNRYAAADPYANCDASTSSPILNVNDFSCFLNRYAAGCT